MFLQAQSQALLDLERERERESGVPSVGYGDQRLLILKKKKTEEFSTSNNAELNYSESPSNRPERERGENCRRGWDHRTAAPRGVWVNGQIIIGKGGVWVNGQIIIRKRKKSDSYGWKMGEWTRKEGTNKGEERSRGER